MIEIEYHDRFLRAIKQLPPAIAAGAEAALGKVKTGYGDPHIHAGLKITKLRNNLFECRIGLRYRIILMAFPGSLVAYDIMTHDELKKFLRAF
ncbi:MAG: hypothetical protein WCO56_23845 [Verrucomicrobiota bacterium]